MEIEEKEKIDEECDDQTEGVKVEVLDLRQIRENQRNEILAKLEENKKNLRPLPPFWQNVVIKGSDILKLRRLLETGQISAAKKFVSLETIEYVSKDISCHMPFLICPLPVVGDGNCLLHGLSLVLWGKNDNYHITLRHLLTEELILHRDFYQKSVDKLSSSSDGYSDGEYDVFISDSAAPNAFLGFIHIFALSNILKRPILLYAADDEQAKFGSHEEGVSGLFLPTRHGSKECKGNPVVLAWSNSQKNHFIPLVLVEGNASFQWPTLGVAFSKTLKGEKAKDYITWGRKNIANDTLEPLVLQLFEHSFIIIQLRGVDTSFLFYRHEIPEEAAQKLVASVNFPPLLHNPVEKIASLLNYESEKFRNGQSKSNCATYYFVKKAPSVSKYIPFSEPYKIMDRPTCSQCLEKIRIFQQELLKDYKHKQVALTTSEMIELTTLVNTLLKYPKDYNSATFRPNGLRVVSKLLEWPLDKVWPGIDLARTLILYKSAAQFYIPQNNAYQDSIFQQIVKWSASEPTIYQVAFLTLQFYMNMFYQEELRRKVLLPFQKQVCSMIAIVAGRLVFTQEQNKKILELVSLLHMNFSSLWNGGNFGFTADHSFVLENVVLILTLNILKSNLDKPNIVKNLLIALGTIIERDGRLMLNVKDWIGPFINYENKEHEQDAAIIRECAIYVAGLVEAPLEFEAVPEEYN